MKSFFTVFLLVTLSGILSLTYGQWLPHTIDQSLSNATIVDVNDIDGDGDLDMAANGSDKVQWYENNSPDTTWAEYTIDNLFRGVVGIAIVDIDGDSILDVVASGYTDSDIRWYRNNLPNPNWPTYIIDNDYYGAEFLAVADIDDDDDPDLVVTGSHGDKVAWFENNLPNTIWTKHIIDDYLGSAMNCDVGDIDGDGDLDVAATGNSANHVRWYENNLPDTNWNQIIIDGNLSGAFGVRIADIDGDDTLDVLATGMTANKLVWYKNENAGQAWIPYPIDTNLLGARNVNVGDIDGDDTLDVLATAFNGDDVVWYENDQLTWNKYFIDKNLDGANYVCTAYINDDDLLDVVATGRLSGELVWYEQEPVWVKTVEILPKYLIPAGDTLFIKAHIVNQENHSVSVNAKIHGETVPFSDSLLLYDDGLHFDENPNDNIWGHAKWLSGLEEDRYIVDIYTHNFNLGTILKYRLLNYFTTNGPVKVHDVDKPVHNPAFSLKLYLRNDGLVDTTKDITAKVSTNDTNVTSISPSIRGFGDIAPGHINSSTLGYIFRTQNNPGSVKIAVSIYSEDYPYWSDSLTVVIVGIEDQIATIPTEYSLRQNYPNPFNPTTTIEFDLPKTSEVSLKIFNILGEEVATLVSDRLTAGSYTYDWDASNQASGLYLYRLESDGFVKTRKMILMK